MQMNYVYLAKGQPISLARLKRTIIIKEQPALSTKTLVVAVLQHLVIELFIHVLCGVPWPFCLHSVKSTGET